LYGDVEGENIMGLSSEERIEKFFWTAMRWRLSLHLLAEALLSAAKQGQVQAEPEQLIKLLLAMPEIKKIYANRQ